jgi:hypothetical protein
MIDDIVLSETLPANVGFEDAPMPLPTIAATLRDDDGSETLSIDIAGLPVGATLSDGEHHLTATHPEQRLTISNWGPRQAVDHPAAPTCLAASR